MFVILGIITIQQWWWVAIAILMAGLSGKYGQIAKENFEFYVREAEGKEHPIQPKYTYWQSVLILCLAILVYVVSLVVMVVVHP